MPRLVASEAEYHRIKALLSDWRWRIDNLYWITDKAGERVKFKLNWAQADLWDNMHYCNVVLKARQLGLTTFIQIFMLDACLFNSNVRAGTIAHNRDDAIAIFRDKVKFPYDNLPDWLKEARPVIRDSANELALSNNSTLRVGTSLRSGTLNYLHVSEYGKLCAKTPEKAREVRTGALNTVQAGQVIFIESTAEGQEGHFYELCQEAEAARDRRAKLSELDFRFHFFPWWKEPGYSIAPAGVIIPVELQRYFEKLDLEHGIPLTAGQRAWYAKKAGNQLDDMKREFPSTSAEAFEASIEGAYYSQQMAVAEQQSRIGEHQAIKGLPVHTAWDIGRSDYTSIWFWQRTHGQIRVVGFFQNCNEGMPYYAEEVKKLYEKHGWSRIDAIDYVPHDAKVKEWGSDRTRVEQMVSKGLKPVIPAELSFADGINAVRDILPICLFDIEACSEGIKVLKSYRKEWDDDKGMFKDTHRHDIYSHGADAFRYLACAHRDLKPVVTAEEKAAQERKERAEMLKSLPSFPTMEKLTEMHDKRMKSRSGRIG